MHKKNSCRTWEARSWVLILLTVPLLLPLPAAANAIHSPAEVAYRIGSLQILGNGPHMLDIGLGAYNFNRRGPSENNDVSALARVEVRLGQKLLFVGPVAGIMANTDGGVFGYAGIYSDVRYRHLVVTPLFAIGGYIRDDSKELGGVFQFRLSLAASYEFANQSRLGITFAHISNASSHLRNPGEQELMLTYAIPF